MTIDLQRASALAVLAIAVVGYAFVFRPLEAAAGDIYVQIDTARAALDHSLAMTRRIPTLEAERRDLAAQLARLHTGDRRPAAVDRFLRAVAGVAARNGITVERLTAGNAQALASPSPTSAPPIEQIPFDLTLRGPYGNVIRAVRDLNERDGSAHIGVASLSNAEHRPGSSPQLNAAFHVLLLRETQELP